MPSNEEVKTAYRRKLSAHKEDSKNRKRRNTMKYEY